MNSSTDNKAFDRVLIIMFENMYRGYVMQNPYMRELAKLGTDMANYHGVMHPSQTNYISSIAGELCNISNDERPEQLLPQDTIVDLIEAKCLNWKAYMQGYCPDSTVWSPDMIPQDNFPYLIKHNPFSSFANIVRNKQRWQRVVSADQLLVDAANNQLPEYAWFTPDMWNDGHYSAGTRSGPAERAPDLVDQQAIWLRYFFGMLKFPGSDSILPDGEYRAMCLRATDAVVQLPNLDWEGFILWCDWTSVRIVLQRLYGRDKAAIPLFGLSNRAILGPPLRSRLELTRRFSGERDFVGHLEKPRSSRMAASTSETARTRPAASSSIPS